MARTLTMAFAALLLVPVAGRAQEKIFSGPQVGEKLLPFKVRGVFDEAAGKDFDFVTRAAGKPIVLVFIHDINRPVLKMTRTLTLYTAERAGEGLATGVILLSDDLTEGEMQLKRWRIALAPKAPLGISEDGKEGPGTYGLNRNVQLTILVGKDNKVTANFPLVQPSIQADLPKILEAVAKVAGGPVPKAGELVVSEMLRYRPVEIQDLFHKVIRPAASPEEVDQAAAALEEQFRQEGSTGREIGNLARTIVEGRMVADFGTPRSQEYLRKWAVKYGGAPAKTKSGARKK